MGEQEGVVIALSGSLSDERGGDALRAGSLSSTTRGAVSELRAGAHLLERGWHVFWSMSPSCPVDMIAWRSGQTPIRVEVKTLGVHEVSDTRKHRSLSVSWPINGEWDLLLAIGPDVVHEVWAPAEYRPTMEAFRTHYGFPPVPLRAARDNSGGNA